jgi:hypothetical protein
MNQNNPHAMDSLARLLHWNGGGERVLPLALRAAQLGWKNAQQFLTLLFKEQDEMRLRLYWGAQCNATDFWLMLKEMAALWREGEDAEFDDYFDQLCYIFGQGLYWYEYGLSEFHSLNQRDKFFASLCLDYYCACVELQQKSIFLFLHFWNGTSVIKGPGRMIGELVWAGREEKLLLSFAEHLVEAPAPKPKPKKRAKK